MIIQLGALLGAMMATFFAAEAAGQPGATMGLGSVFVGAPLLGSIWGAAVGAAIHFAANGDMWSWMLALIGFVI